MYNESTPVLGIASVGKGRLSPLRVCLAAQQEGGSEHHSKQQTLGWVSEGFFWLG